MKKILFPLIFSLLILVNIGCTKGDTWVNNQLLGVWDNKADTGLLDQTRTVEWSFMGDGTLEIAYIEFNKSTGELLGYSNLVKGNYSIKDDVLFMTEMVSYSFNAEGANYIEIEDASYYMNKDSFFLKEPTGIWSNSASVSFSNRKRELKLTYPECNDVNAICVGSENLIRK